MGEPLDVEAPLTRNLADEWGQLVAEWEVAMADYRTAASPRDPAPQGEASPAMEAASARLAELKSRMDAVVAAGKAARGTKGRDGRLIVKSLDRGDRERGTAPDDPDADSGPDT